jgi:hypothetical protein
MHSLYAAVTYTRNMYGMAKIPLIVFTIIISIYLAWTALDKRFSKGWYDRRGSFSYSFMCWNMPQSGDYKSFHEAWRTRQLILTYVIFCFGILASIGVFPGRNQEIDFSTWKGSYTLSLIVLAVGPAIAIFSSYETRIIRKIPAGFISSCLSHINDRAIQIFFLSIGSVPSIAALIYLIFNFKVTYY